jgi:hypothetical protein
MKRTLLTCIIGLAALAGNPAWGQTSGSVNIPAIPPNNFQLSCDLFYAYTPPGTYPENFGWCTYTCKYSIFGIKDFLPAGTQTFLGPCTNYPLVTWCGKQCQYLVDKVGGVK